MRRTRHCWIGSIVNSVLCNEHFTNDCFEEMHSLHQSFGSKKQQNETYAPYAVSRDLYSVYTTSINHANTVVKSLLREFLNHTGTPKQGSTIMVASAHISDSIYTCN